MDYYGLLWIIMDYYGIINDNPNKTSLEMGI